MISIQTQYRQKLHKKQATKQSMHTSITDRLSRARKSAQSAFET